MRFASRLASRSASRSASRKAAEILTVSLGLYRELALSALELLPGRR